MLGYHEWLEGLERGIAAHHAGMLPTFKEVVEELFVRGLVKAVFATETLALGINMPARSVVLERLVKWNGESARRRHAGGVHPAHRPRRPTGHRRRGPRGRASGSPGSTRPRWPGSPRPAPTRCGPASARRTTWRSTWSARSAATGPATCWSRRSRSSRPTGRWSGWPGRCAATRRRSTGYREAMTCHLGDFEEYAGLRRAIADREADLSRSGAANRQAAGSRRRWSSCGPATSSGCRPGAAPAWRSCSTPARRTGADGPRPTVLTAERQVRRLSLADFPVPVESLHRLRIPKTFNPRNPAQRRDLASTLRNTGLEDAPRR